MRIVLKAIKTFFLSIWKFIDKIFILPLTKLFVKIGDRFNKSGRFLENWLTKRNTLLFISMFLAIVIFIVIDQKIVTFSKNSAEVLRSIPVKTVYNEEAYVVEGIPESVDITLIGSKTNLFIAKQITSYDVTLDLTGLTPGQHRVAVKYNQSLAGLDYMVNPSVVNITIYNKISATKTLVVDVLNKDKLDDKLVISKTSIASDRVIVKGSAEQLEQVATVKALLDASSIVEPEVGKYTVREVPLKAYDLNGEVVDVEIVPNKIDVDLEIISPSKEVPIKIVPVGEVAFGKAISSLDTDITKVMVYGDEAVLEDFNFLTVEIDVNELKNNKEFKVDIKKPVGITYMSVNSITINVVLDAVSERDIKDVRVVYRNLKPGLRPTAATASDGVVVVNVKGVESILKDLTAEDIVAYVDLEGLDKGTHEVDVIIEGSDPRLQYLSKTKKVRIEIR